jgi:hypothetical protein
MVVAYFSVLSRKLCGETEEKYEKVRYKWK